ncbi:hypothetical protein CPB83DRAFT_904707, partial [Crepidotus variabilis]
MAKSTPLIHCACNPSTTCIPCSEVSHLDGRIHKARIVLERLEARRKAMDSVLNRHHDPFIHRLPTEIASNIFQLCCPIGLSAMFDPNFNDVQQQKTQAYRKSLINPLVLGAVCRYWRAVAFSTPNLWNTIDISSRNLLLGYYLSLAREWLDRSATLPLHIQFIVHVNSEEDFLLPKIANVIELLNGYSSRWLTLDLTLPSNLLDIFHCAKGTILDTIHISTYPFDNTEAQTFDLGTLTSPSVLEICYSTLGNMKLDYSKLVKFSCWDVTGKEFAQIASVATRLEILLVLRKLIEHPQDSQPTISSTAFLHVRKFHLPAHPPAVWKQLKMPSLQDLAINDDEQIHPNLCWPEVQEFVQRSQCRLTTLFVGGNNDSYHGIFELLCLLPELESLVVQHPQLPEAFFQHMYNTARLNLSQTTGSNPFLPCLRSFTYSWIRSVTWSWVRLLIPPATDNEGTYRPLVELIFSIAWNTTEVEMRIDDDTVKTIVDARNRGIVVDISAIREGDVIALSMEENGGQASMN